MSNTSGRTSPFPIGTVRMVTTAEPPEGPAVPGLFVPVPGVTTEPGPDMTLTEVTRDGSTWRLGNAADVAWINAGTEAGTAITAAIPAVFDAYATIELPQDRTDQRAYDAALLSVLRAHVIDQQWWLGYLDTGADDVVFPSAPRVTLYYGWSYVLVLAGSEQASVWRGWDLGSFWAGHLPNLIFPLSRNWLLSTLWDDDWTCVGGTDALIDDLLRHPELSPHVRRVETGHNATPPGHSAT